MSRQFHDLPVVLRGQRLFIDDEIAGRIHVFFDGPESGSKAPRGAHRPVLLIHSINASASAHEVQPIFDALKQDRNTYAMDLPGFGHSERSDRDYTQALMVHSILAVAREISARNGGSSVDVLAVSLSCEFLAKAANEDQGLIRSLALVSPTGFAKNASRKGVPEDDCGRPGVLKFLKRPKIGRALYRLLSSPPSIRFFLRKTWGRKQIDETMFENSCAMAKHPNAHRAPFYFLSGYLFSANIPMAYQAIRQRVWMSHGTRGDFTDYSRREAIDGHGNWQITQYEAGALPYFEVGAAFFDRYREFLDTQAVATAA